MSGRSVSASSVFTVLTDQVNQLSIREINQPMDEWMTMTWLTIYLFSRLMNHFKNRQHEWDTFKVKRSDYLVHQWVSAHTDWGTSVHTCTATVLRHYGLFCIVSPWNKWQKHGHWQKGSWQAFDKHLTVDTTPSFATLIWQSPRWTTPLSAHFTNGISLPSEDWSHLIESLDGSLPGSTLIFLGLGSGSATGTLCMIHPWSWLLGSPNCDWDSSSWVVMRTNQKEY